MSYTFEEQLGVVVAGVGLGRGRDVSRMLLFLYFQPCPHVQMERKEGPHPR